MSLGSTLSVSAVQALVEGTNRLIQQKKTTAHPMRSRGGRRANYRPFKDRLKRALDKQDDGKGLPDVQTAYRHNVLTSVGSREGYEQLLKEGLQDKPLNDLLKFRRDQKKVKNWRRPT